MAFRTPHLVFVPTAETKYNVALADHLIPMEPDEEPEWEKIKEVRELVLVLNARVVDLLLLACCCCCWHN